MMAAEGRAVGVAQACTHTCSPGFLLRLPTSLCTLDSLFSVSSSLVHEHRPAPSTVNASMPCAVSGVKVMQDSKAVRRMPLQVRQTPKNTMCRIDANICNLCQESRVALAWLHDPCASRFHGIHQDRRHQRRLRTYANSIAGATPSARAPAACTCMCGEPSCKCTRTCKTD